MLLRQIESIGQDTSDAQEHRMRRHVCDFLTVDVSTGPSELIKTLIGVMDAGPEEGAWPDCR
jgi:hypothetical protein